MNNTVCNIHNQIMAESAPYVEYLSDNKPSINAEVLTRTGKPTCIIVLGMRGSGKTTFVKNLVNKFYVKGFPFVINLDPGCERVPYPPNIDIRDTINYRDVMDGFDMNVNDSLVTALNIYSTKVNKLIEMIETDGEFHECIIVDAPGLKEMFAWWACGSQITRAIAARFLTVVVYLMDTVSCAHPHTFLSNVVYLNSIMRVVRLPFIIAMNKIDVMNHSYAVNWLHDSEAFQEALDSINSNNKEISSEPIASIFHQVIANSQICGISARTGEGISSFFKLLHGIVEGANMLISQVQEAIRAAHGGVLPLAPNGQILDLIVRPLSNDSDDEYVDMNNERREFFQDLDMLINEGSFQTTLQFYKKLLETNYINHY